MTHFEDPSLFPVIERHCWLNHAAISAWPTPVLQAVRGFVEENQNHGAKHYEQWMAKEETLRVQLAQFLNAPSADDISLLRNTSEALNIIAQGIHWKPGDEVVFPANEFPSNALPWHALTSRGVTVKAVSLDQDQPEQSLIDAIGPNTRLVSVSAVQFDTGLRLDLKRIGLATKRAGGLFCVDAIQSLGALDMQISDLPVDFVVSGSHKWLMAPEGIGFMWSRNSVRQAMTVALPGWRMYDDPFNFNRVDLAPPNNGRRFETGTVNMFGIHGLLAAIELLNQLDPAKTAEALLDRTDYLIEQLSALTHINLITPTEREQRAGIVCFRVHGTDAECMVETLAKQDIYVAKRGHNIRVSPHFYTPFEQLDAFLAPIQDPQMLAACAA